MAKSQNLAAADEDGRLQAIQSEILERIACGENLEVTADMVCRRFEALAPGARCSLLSVSEDGTLHPLAGPSLSEEYSKAIDGVSIGPEAGSCGSAAYYGEPVLVTDISTDPKWRNYRALVEPMGLNACWSSPIKARGGRVLGTFAIYYEASRGPSDIERRAVDTCVHVCAIALEQAEIRERNLRLAYFDTMTGLPNRVHADRLLGERAEAGGTGLGLLVVDIDNLKVTNDTLGHAVGRRTDPGSRPEARVERRRGPGVPDGGRRVHRHYR